MPLLGPNGQPISSSTYKKAPAPAMGPAFGDWAGRDVIFNQMPGGAILQFDLESLTLQDLRAMRHHPQINASLMLLMFMMHQMDWHIECQEKKIADMVEANMRDIWTRLMRACSQSFWAGYSPNVLEYENDANAGAIVITKVKDLYPEESMVHWKEVEGYAPPNAVAPKFKVYDGIDHYSGKISGQVKSDGSFVTSRSGNYKNHIPVENTLWYPLLMENGNYYGRRILKSAFAPWYFSTLVHLFANRYYERFGEPVPVGRADFDDTVEVEGDILTGKQVMENILRSIRNRSVVVLPSDRDPVTKEFDYTLEYLESQMRGADFERYLSRLDEEISLAIFTPMLLMRTGDVGSHNLGVQHTQTWLWMLNALAGDLKEYFDRYICERLKAINFSPNAPKVQWVFRPMGKENTETIRAIITELLRKDKVGVDLNELGQFLGMSLKEIRQATEPQDDPDVDTRTDRNRPGSDGPRGVGEPRATGREISNRIRSQVSKAFAENSLERLVPAFGYNKRMVHAWQLEGADVALAQRRTDQIFGELQTWFSEATSLGANNYSGVGDFMAMFERAIDAAIDHAATV